ncbi:hypothetical protein [Candidatus Rhodobacter oscarellae]|uniref:hypothetical protein n=1 Tax=Candidatus Rhodobacter oscarellae TaxID=1675527 RepID=UPI000670FB4D|nr:hypothetical protein [Candidatus Rhodobacter lobularis]
MSRDLHRYVRDVTVDDLRNSQVAAIYVIMHGRHSEGEKRMLIRSTVGGRNTLRGLLFNR